MTWDKQLNYSVYTALHSDQRITSKSLMQATNKYTGLFSNLTQYAEDALEKAIRQGVKQYVILGAGMDIFTFIQTEMLGKL